MEQHLDHVSRFRYYLRGILLERRWKREIDSHAHRYSDFARLDSRKRCSRSTY